MPLLPQKLTLKHRNPNAVFVFHFLETCTLVWHLIVIEYAVPKDADEFDSFDALHEPMTGYDACNFMEWGASIQTFLVHPCFIVSSASISVRHFTEHFEGISREQELCFYRVSGLQDIVTLHMAHKIIAFFIY